MTPKDTFIATLVRHAGAIAAGSLIMVLALGFGASRLQLESGIKVFFSKSDPNLLAQERIERTYGREDNILLVIEARSGDIFSADNLVSLQHITEQSWLIPNSRRVDSLNNYLYPTVEGDDIHIGPLVEDAASLTVADIAQVRETALSQQPLMGRLLSENGSVTAVNVSLNLGLPGTDKATAIAESVTSSVSSSVWGMQAGPASASTVSMSPHRQLL